MLADSEKIAQAFNMLPGSQFQRLGVITASSLIGSIIVMILIATSIILLGILIVGGIMVMTSGGDKQKSANGQQAVTAAVIGLVIIFGAWAIINLINLFFGINIINLNVPSAQSF